MPILDEKEFAKLTKLCRIECPVEEQVILQQKISAIISYVTQLEELDTKNVIPCYQVSPNSADVLRDDEEGPLLSREEFLSISPSHIGGMIKVPPVMKPTT